MIRNKLFNKFISSQLRVQYTLRSSSTKIDIAKLEQESIVAPIDSVTEEARLKEEYIEKSRNKSRLNQKDRCVLMEENPYPEPLMYHHGTLKYQRRIYGRYGQSSGVNPSICWPVKEELEDSKEYERVAYPFTIPEMIAKANQEKQEKIEKINARQEEVHKKMLKLEDWKKDMFNRIAKKEADAKAAKARKERLVEEVRRHFGYAVDLKDEKFKEMLEIKEKEQKKALKEERKKQKEAKMLEKLLNKKSNDNDSPTNKTTNEDTVEENKKINKKTVTEKDE